MKRIDSDALSLLYRELGLGGGEEQPTMLDDATLSMVLPVADSVRRARSTGVTSGWFIGVIDNIHPAAGPISANVDPYAAGDARPAGNRSAYPSPLLQGTDLWLLGASLTVAVGTPALNSGSLSLDPLPIHQAWGIDNLGAAVVNSGAFAVLRWSALDSANFGITGDGSSFGSVRIRLPRGVTLTVSTDATAAGTFRTVVVLGVFPEGLGQDIAL